MSNAVKRYESSWKLLGTRKAPVGVKHEAGSCDTREEILLLKARLEEQYPGIVIKLYPPVGWIDYGTDCTRAGVKPVW